MNMEALVKEIYGPGDSRTAAARWPSDRPRPAPKPQPRRVALPDDLPWRERLAQFRKMLDDGLTTE